MEKQVATVPAGDMAEQRKDVVVGLRLPKDFLKRADALIRPLQSTDVGAAGSLSRAKVLRLAVARGLEALESEHK